MKNAKRMFAFISALALAFSYNAPSFVAIAEDTVDLKDSVGQQTEDVSEPTTEENDLELNVVIPDNWTNNFDEWTVDVSTDATLYYKTSETPLANHMWGTYSDSDAKLWNDGTAFEDGEGYIKFWAVRKQDDQDEVVDCQALTYKYDTTIPDAFSVEKIRIDDKTFDIKSSSSISDNLSSNLEIYYVLDNSELTKKSEIEAVGNRISLNDNNGEYGFNLHGEPSMIDHEVVFYVIDEAGNIQHTSIVIKDTSKPYLSVSGIDTDENKWSNTLNWLVTSIPTENVSIYYKTSDKNEFDWGAYESASVWNSEWDSEALADVIPENHHYVHFWAAYDNDSDHEVAEETFHYNFDKTKPTEFAVNMSDPFWPQPGNFWWSQRSFSTDATFYENGSGIESVTYKIGNGGEQYIAYTESNGGYKFEININNDENLANNALTFIVRDKAKNEQTFVIDAVNSSKPIIKEASVVYSDNKEELEKATSKHSLIFGDERSKTYPYSNAVYANNNDYIKLEVDDASLNSIIVNVNGKQQSLGVRNQQEAERNGIIVYSDKSNYRYKNCYIPVSKLNGLNKQGVNTISFVIKSHNNTKSEEAYLLDSKDNHCDIFYDPKDQDDSTVSFSATPQYVDADGKKYYDDLYEAEAVQREEKLLKEAESVKSQSVFSAVEKFKKNYVEKPVQERKMPQTKGPKLSTEEQKVLMREERKRKSKDAGKD